MRSRSLVVALVSLVAGGCVGDAPADPVADDSAAGAGLGSSTNGDSNGGSEGASIYARVCAGGTTTKGVDVSYYQGSVNWTTLKTNGYAFAFLRTSDGSFHDPKFATNWAATKSAGVIRGAYQFFRPAQNVTTQADYLISSIGGSYTPGDLPPVLDVEDTGGLSASTVAAKVRQWVDYVHRQLGVTPIIYTGKYFWRDQVGGPSSFVGNPLWIAQYSSLCPDLPAPWSTWKFWQNSGSGSAPGVSGQVDLDKFNGSLADLQAFVAAVAPTSGDDSGTTTQTPPPTTCASGTLDKTVDDGVCVQSAGDGGLYECSAGMWTAASSTSGCSQTYAWCDSATLGQSVPPRTCVQASSDHLWYQCDGTRWASGVANGAGPAGTCSQMFAL